MNFDHRYNDPSSFRDRRSDLMPHFPPSRGTTTGFGRSVDVPFGGTGPVPAFPPPSIAAPFSSIGPGDRGADSGRGHGGGRSFDTGHGGGRGFDSGRGGRHGGGFGGRREFDGGHGGLRGFDRGYGGGSSRGFDGGRRGGRGGGSRFAKPRDDLDNKRSGQEKQFGFVHFAERSAVMKALKDAEKFELYGEVLE